MTASLTERQQRERAFYAQYAHRQRVAEIDFAPVLGRESRPWNPYWYVHEQVRTRFTGPSARLLDFGCGIGISAVRFARVGYQVDGFDLSPDNLAIARRLAVEYSLTQRCRFQAMPAESLTYPDNTFDVVVGIDILHHVEISKAVAEACRVLKPGGLAIFKEHVEVPGYDALRNTAVVRRLVSNAASLDDHITEDERKLSRADVATIHSHFDEVQARRFTLLSRLERLLPVTGEGLRQRLQRVDHRLMRALPPLRQWGGTAVYLCRKAEVAGEAAAPRRAA